MVNKKQNIACTALLLLGIHARLSTAASKTTVTCKVIPSSTGMAIDDAMTIKELRNEVRSKDSKAETIILTFSDLTPTDKQGAGRQEQEPSGSAQAGTSEQQPRKQELEPKKQVLVNYCIEILAKVQEAIVSDLSNLLLSSSLRDKGKKFQDFLIAMEKRCKEVTNEQIQFTLLTAQAMNVCIKFDKYNDIEISQSSGNLQLIYNSLITRAPYSSYRDEESSPFINIHCNLSNMQLKIDSSWKNTLANSANIFNPKPVRSVLDGENPIKIEPLDLDRLSTMNAAEVLLPGVPSSSAT